MTIASDGGAISVAGIRGDSSETVTITADITDGGDASTTETIALTGAIGNLNEIGAVTLNGADGITMSGNITLADSAGADLDVNGKVFISGDVTIDTHNTTDDGTINFSSTIDGVSGGADDDLVILAGDTDAGASLTITGNIGDGVPLTTLKINESAGTVALSIPQIGGGDTAGVTGQVDIGNTNSASVTMSAATYDFGAGNVNITGNTTFSGANNLSVDTLNASGDGGDFTVTGTVAISNGNLDINTKGGNINITGAISSAGTDETLTLDDGTGTGTITLGSSATSGSITLIGDSGITLTGNLVTTDTADGAIALTGPVTLAGDITIDADANNTSVTNSTATVNSDDASTKRDLTINTGAGAVAMQGIIGGSVALDAISINAATAGAGTVEVANIAGAAGAVSIGNGATATLTLDGTTYTSTGAQTYEANDINITAGADVTFTTTNTAVEFQDGAAGQIVLSDDTDLIITTSGGNITIAPTIAGTDSGGGNTAEDITLNAAGGTVTLSNTGAAVLATDIGDVTLTGATIALSNSITSTGTNSAGNAATIDINGAVTLNDNDITFTTGGAGIDFSSTIVSGSTTPRALTIAQGTGAVVINGNIGGTANNDVGNITIGATGHNGNITLSGDIGTDSVAGAAVVALGNANTGLITLGGAEYNTSGTQTYTADDYNLNGTAITLTTSNDIVTFNDGGGDGSIDLADAAALTIGTSGANILSTFQSLEQLAVVQQM